MYIQPKRLAQLILQAKKENKVNEELATVIINIASGLLSRFHWPIAEDEYRQEVFVHFLNHYKGINTRRNVFSYITQCARNLAYAMLRRQGLYNRRFGGSLPED